MPATELPDTAAQTSPERPWPVRLLSAKIAAYVDRMSPLWVEGQVVQVIRRPGTNTAYLTLRDSDVDMSLPVTAHRRVLDDMTVPLAEGATVVVHARPEFWTKRGTLQLSARAIRPVGVGELLARLEHLKRLLASEGLLDPSRRKPLPFLPGVVGLVCGRGSAAERDVVENARRRWPGVRFAIREVAVQGPQAVSAVSAAISELDGDPAVEVIVVARGGGSLEDLLPFSNEALVRAAAACRTPLVSAIGHEVDSPLLDLVADLRASTPTDAAKHVVPDVAQEMERVVQASRRTRRALATRLEREQSTLAAIRARPVLADPTVMIDRRAEQVDRAQLRGRQCLHHVLDREGDAVAHLRVQVGALSPAATLARGYAVVQGPGGDVVRSPRQVPEGSDLRIRLDRGELAARVTNGRPQDA